MSSHFSTQVGEGGEGEAQGERERPRGRGGTMSSHFSTQARLGPAWGPLHGLSPTLTLSPAVLARPLAGTSVARCLQCWRRGLDAATPLTSRRANPPPPPQAALLIWARTGAADTDTVVFLDQALVAHGTIECTFLLRPLNRTSAIDPRRGHERWLHQTRLFLEGLSHENRTGDAVEEVAVAENPAWRVRVVGPPGCTAPPPHCAAC